MFDPIPVTRSAMPSFEEYVEEIRSLWESRWLTNMGEKHRSLEAQLCGLLDSPHVSLFSNGHLALESVLRAMKLPEGSEVITTPFTFASTTNAIIRCGLIPVFCDVRPEDCTIDAGKIESLITERTSAMLPVHVYGNLCDVDALQCIAEKHSLKLIYDAAHAFGVRYHGKSAAAYGDASMFSFHATKVFHTVEGGCVCFKDDTLARRLNGEKNFGLMGIPDTYESVGGNAKMSEFHAAMGLCNLRHLDEAISHRKSVVERYRKNLHGVEGIRLLDVQNDVESNYAYFPVIFDGYRLERDQVMEKLAKNNIFSRKYFYPPTNEMDSLKGRFDCGVTPVATYLSARVLTMPLYPELSLDDVDRICAIILDSEQL